MSKKALFQHITSRLFSSSKSQFNVKSRLNPVKNIYQNSKFLILEENDKKSYKYPLVWLRDNCQCVHCFHQGSSSRTINWEKFSVNQELTAIERCEDSKKVTLTWADGHKSIFDDNWLLSRNFSPENQKTYLSTHYRPDKNPVWGKNDFQKTLKKFDYSEVISTDRGLFEWLDTLSRRGIAIIQNTPLTRDECRKLANRVGFIRKTHYGEEFEVIAKEGTSNVAYLSSALQLHTDLPYYDYKPGVNLLHCLVQSQSEGGFNQITDGFFVAQKMKEDFPAYFKVLSETLVNWSDIGQEDGNKFHSIYRAPVIMLDHEGKFSRINHSVPQRDSFFTVNVDDVELWYQAMKKFVNILHDETVVFKTQPGEILTFDNIRLIHGRTEYKDNTNNTRHIIGSYLDWDEIYSRLRVLRSSLQC